MRLITRPSLDGVMCAVLLGIVEKPEQVIYANPADIEDGSFKIQPGDFIANLPYHSNAAAWFDHHDIAEALPDALPNLKGKRGKAPSAARLIYDYYADSRLFKFSDILIETDRISAGDLTIDEVFEPSAWTLLSFTLDPYMGLSGFNDYANIIVSGIRHGATIDQLLDTSEVKGRIQRYLLDTEDFVQSIKEISRVEGNVLISDARKLDIMPTGNRFLAFGLFPETNVQLAITKHSKKNKVRVRLGKSIFNRTCNIRLGNLAAEFGGGGLAGAAGFLLDPDGADEKIAKIIDLLKRR